MTEEITTSSKPGDIRDKGEPPMAASLLEVSLVAMANKTSPKVMANLRDMASLKDTDKVTNLKGMETKGMANNKAMTKDMMMAMAESIQVPDMKCRILPTADHKARHRHSVREMSTIRPRLTTTLSLVLSVGLAPAAF